MSHRKKNKAKSSTSAVLSTALLQRMIKAGRRAEAQDIAQKILQQGGNHPAALRTCAETAMSAGDFELAYSLSEQLCTVKPDDAWGWMTVGVCRMAQGDWSGARALLETAERLAPEDPAVCGQLSSLHFHLMNFECSLHYADRSITADPSNFSAHNARGAALLKLLRYQEALLSLARAIELYPGDYYEDAVNNLGLTLHDMRRYAEAYACYEQMLMLNPEDVGAVALLVHSAFQICHWQGLDRWVSQLLQSIRAGQLPGGIPPFVFLSVPGMTRNDHLHMAIRAEEMLAARVEERPTLDQLPALLPDRKKLRIGYLSADFHQHATSQLIAEVIEQHDRSRFEVVAYSYGPDDGSEMRERMCSAFDIFRNLQSASWVDGVEIIRNDAVDILVDLKGWTHDTRLELSARRPAPIVVSWLGYPGTLGVPGMADYIIGDRYVTPLDHADGYSETIVQLPHSYQPNDRCREVGDTPSRESLGLPEDVVVFCSFNQAYKINEEVFSLWCDILRQVPGSVLWLLQPEEVAVENLYAVFERAGLARSRLVFAPKQPLAQHLGRLRQASLALDTAPVGSHTTASDVLWVGVPIVTCPGETFASRVAASLLAAAGVPELITDTMEDYVALAVHLGNDARALAAIRQKLAEQRDSCALFDSIRFTRDLERAYELMVEDARAGRRGPIVV